MEPEYDGSGSEDPKPKTGLGWNPIGYEEKKAAIDSEMERLRRLPATSTYAVHRLRLLDQIQKLLSRQRTKEQDEELESLFSGLRL